MDYEQMKREMARNQDINQIINKYINNQINHEPDQPMTYEKLNEVIEFLITFNIIDYRQALDIRTKAIPFLKG